MPRRARVRPPVSARCAAFAVGAWISLSTATASFACPVCHTETGVEVRAGIFDEQFAKNVALTLIPFPVLVGVVAVIHFGLPASIPFRKSGKYRR